MPLAVKARLQRAMRDGSLTVADLSSWFGRDYHTVYGWVYKGRVPWGPNGDGSLRLLGVLEAAIARQRHFPVPIHLSPRERRVWMTQARHDLDRGVPAARAAD